MLLKTPLLNEKPAKLTMQGWLDRREYRGGNRTYFTASNQSSSCPINNGVSINISYQTNPYFCGLKKVCNVGKVMIIPPVGCIDESPSGGFGSKTDIAYAPISRSSYFTNVALMRPQVMLSTAESSGISPPGPNSTASQNPFAPAWNPGA